MLTTAKPRNRWLSAYHRQRPSLVSPAGAPRGIVRDTSAPEGSTGPLWPLRSRLRVTGPRPRASWRHRKAGRSQQHQLRRPRHARLIFAKYSRRQPAVRSWGQPAGSPWSPRSLRMRMASSSERALPSLLRCAQRAPCAFTETAVKRAIRALRAAGETPSRIVVTKDGFAIELGAASAVGASGNALVPIADDDDDDDDVFAKLDHVND